jgi:hypothetical protein
MKSPGPQAIGDLLSSALPGLGHRLMEQEIRHAWPEVAGAEAARRAQPVKLVNGCLEIAVDNSPWLHELTLRTVELTGRLSARFPHVRGVRFVLGPALVERPAPRPPRPVRRAMSSADARAIEETVAAIGNDGG